MEGTYIWRLKLPYSFAIDDNVSAVVQINQKLEFEFVKRQNERIIDILQVSYQGEIPDNINQNDLISVYEKVKVEVGSLVNKFCKALAQTINTNFQHVYNGDDFILPYIFIVLDLNKNILWQLHFDSTRILQEKDIQKIIVDFNSTNSDVVKELLYQSEKFLQNGFFDMAILNGHVALEFFLPKFFEGKKPSTEVLVDFLKHFKENHWVDKYLNYAPFLIYKRSLLLEHKELFYSIMDLHYLRDCVAHKGTALEHKLLKDRTREEVYSFVEDLLMNVEDTIDWVIGLENSNTMGVQKT